MTSTAQGRGGSCRGRDDRVSRNGPPPLLREVRRRGLHSPPFPGNSTNVISGESGAVHPWASFFGFLVFGGFPGANAAARRAPVAIGGLCMVHRQQGA